jgi:hypothetical protein
MKFFFKKFSEYSTYLFLLAVIVGSLKVLGIFQYDGLALKKTAIVYNVEQAKHYSSHDAATVLRGNQSLSSEDITTLIEKMKPNEVDTNKDINYCKECVNSLKEEREDRISAEKKNKSNQKWIFGLTVAVGLFLFYLKSKKYGPKILNDEENREDVVTGIEFIFAVIVIWITM